MNLSDLKYVAEIARTGSMTQAAVNLFMNQPNLSKAVISLEKELGITIFRRSSKGVSLTKEGNDFLLSTKEILEKFEMVEARYKAEEMIHYFGISVPRASYISTAFSRFASEISGAKKLQINFYETNSMKTIQNISSRKHSLGIIRYAVEYERYYNKLLADLDLYGDMLLEFDYLALMSEKSPLADQEQLKPEDFVDFIEIVHGDYTIPLLSTSEIQKPMHNVSSGKTIALYDRGSQFDVLSDVWNTYMWVSPIPKEMLKRYHLVQKHVFVKDNLYRDVMIRPKAYQMTDTDRKFLSHLYRVRDMISA